MANEIYNSSWWGEFSSTGFGNIYYDIANSLISGFTTRVIADGGTVESSECITITN